MIKRPIINQALRLVRIYAELSQADLAKRLGVAQSLVSDVEGGRKSVSMDLLEKYGSALDVKMSQLLLFAEGIDGQPIAGRGKLIVAEAVLKLLERLKPDAHVGA